MVYLNWKSFRFNVHVVESDIETTYRWSDEFLRIRRSVIWGLEFAVSYNLVINDRCVHSHFHPT